MADESTDKGADKAVKAEKPATAAETAAAQAVKATQQKGLTAEERAAQDTTRNIEKQGAETHQLLDDPRNDNELHQISDLMAASSRLYGVAPEVVAGACHLAGLEMTNEVTSDDLATHIRSFLDQPA